MNLNGYQQTVRVIRIEKKLKSIMPLGSGSQILLGQVGRRLVWALTHWQGCCLTGARSPEAPKLRVRATKVLFKEPEWAPKDRVFIPN